MGTAEHMAPCRRLDRSFYSLSRDGDSGNASALRVRGDVVFLFAVARWGQRNGARVEPRTARFYSLSRDGDSGTSATRPRCSRMNKFLFAVARWGQRNDNADQGNPDASVSIRCREMGTAERSNLRPPVIRAHRSVSIRCREMGTAEQDLAATHVNAWALVGFYSLSRDGDSGTGTGAPSGRRGLRSFYSLSRDGDSGTAGDTPGSIAIGLVSIRCREMGTAERLGER